MLNGLPEKITTTTFRRKAKQILNNYAAVLKKDDFLLEHVRREKKTWKVGLDFFMLDNESVVFQQGQS